MTLTRSRSVRGTLGLSAILVLAACSSTPAATPVKSAAATAAATSAPATAAATPAATAASTAAGSGSIVAEGGTGKYGECLVSQWYTPFSQESGITVTT